MTNDLKVLKEQLDTLDWYIKSLTTWDSYAEDCQREYDFILKLYNEALKKESLK